MSIRLDRLIDALERVGSDVAIVPVAGLVAGPLKVAGGVLQVTFASTCYAALPLVSFAVGEEERILSLRAYSWTHIKHGMGNVLAGTLETLPIVGTVLSLKRTQDYITINEFYESQRGKFMPYQSLIDYEERHHGRPYSL